MSDQWQQRSLASLGSYENGFAFNELHWSEHGLPIIRIAQITGSQGIVDHFPGVLSDSYRIDDGDLIFSWSGTLAVVRWSGGPAWLNQHLFKVVPADGIDRSFLFHVLQASVAEMGKRTHGSTMKHIKRGELREFLVEIPGSEREQRKIAQILDTLDTAIRETEALIDKLKAVKQGLLHDLLTRGIDANGQLRPPQSEAPQLYKESPLGWIPKEWDVQSLENLVANGSPITYGVVQPGPEIDGGILFIRGGDIYGGKILVEQLRTISTEVSNSYRRTQLVGGELLMSLVGYPGEVALVPSKLAGANIARQAALIRLDNTVFSMFVMYYLSSTDGKRQVLGQSLGSAQQVVNLSDLRCVKVPLPPRDEQEVIASRVSVSQEKIEQEIVELGKLLEVKAGLMDDLLTGRVRVTPLLESVQQPAAPTGA